MRLSYSYNSCDYIRIPLTYSMIINYIQFGEPQQVDPCQHARAYVIASWRHLASWRVTPRPHQLTSPHPFQTFLESVQGALWP